MSAIPDRIRKQVWARSEGICECGCGRAAGHLHHRLPRSGGGGHTMDNIAHLAPACHDWAHAHPEMSYRLGLLVRRGDDPARVPMFRSGAADGAA